MSRGARLLRVLIALALVFTLAAVGGLELWYRSLLPEELPTARTRPHPDVVREMVWLSACRGHDAPSLRPMYPFLLRMPLLDGERGDTCLAILVARPLMMPRREPHLKHAVREVALATWISRHWTAEQAIDEAASEVWMGKSVNGLRGAAFVYFGASLESLDVAEQALLVAMMRSPAYFSPLCHPERARKARDELLRQLADAGWLDSHGLAAATAQQLGVLGQCADARSKAAQPGSGGGAGPQREG